LSDNLFQDGTIKQKKATISSGFFNVLHGNTRIDILELKLHQNHSYFCSIHFHQIQV